MKYALLYKVISIKLLYFRCYFFNDTLHNQINYRGVKRLILNHKFAEYYYVLS